MPKELLIGILSALIVLVVTIVITIVMDRLGLNRARMEARNLMNEAQTKADNHVRQATLEAKTQAYEIKLNAEKELKVQRKELQDFENKLGRREDNLSFKDANLVEKEKEISKKQRELESKKASLDKMESVLQERIDVQLAELERVSNMSVDAAKAELFDVVEKQMENETLAYIKEQEEQAHLRAEEISRNIISLAISRYSQDEVVHNTSSVISLPNEEMKGRIIGREGRNIRAFEQATGVDLIIDDTPEVITVSCFDPIRREIAKLSLETLVQDGRIQPGRIEEVVEKVRKDLNQVILKTGQDTLFELGIGKVDKELVAVLGRLKYRYSYGQNALSHSVEVAHLAGMMAAELGLSQKLAKRAGLFHDIGKGLDFEMEGSHVELGVRLAKKCKEHPVVINAIASHHGDTEATSAISVLVAAADALSAARPGARFESFENYIQRLEDLEAIASTKEGVQRVFAISAGRELRVMVVPNEVDDLQTTKLAREIREEIEEQLTYPGQIKVTVIRELRAQELAK
ncbi:ribonuclease Y [Erysipelothrix larvae]|uniref:Ribonuclease Y n=1 Tax=Erysipelothrix larvae TaxID=1514105 RepID=A0A0X8GZU9_9FIRM|nr:ribonuclease Y [Erysipelothrix larvae]AMC93489.1 ribonuclease Y [Erysipelothrix larvae]